MDILDQTSKADLTEILQKLKFGEKIPILQRFQESRSIITLVKIDVFSAEKYGKTQRKVKCFQR